MKWLPSDVSYDAYLIIDGDGNFYWTKKEDVINKDQIKSPKVIKQLIGFLAEKLIIVSGADEDGESEANQSPKTFRTVSTKDCTFLSPSETSEDRIKELNRRDDIKKSAENFSNLSSEANETQKTFRTVSTKDSNFLSPSETSEDRRRELNRRDGIKKSAEIFLDATSLHISSEPQKSNNSLDNTHHGDVSTVLNGSTLDLNRPILETPGNGSANFTHGLGNTNILNSAYASAVSDPNNPLSLANIDESAEFNGNIPLSKCLPSPASPPNVFYRFTPVNDSDKCNGQNSSHDSIKAANGPFQNTKDIQVNGINYAGLQVNQLNTNSIPNDFSRSLCRSGNDMNGSFRLNDVLAANGFNLSLNANNGSILDRLPIHSRSPINGEQGNEFFNLNGPHIELSPNDGYDHLQNSSLRSNDAPHIENYTLDQINDNLFRPPNPPEDTYSCPNCKKGPWNKAQFEKHMENNHIPCDYENCEHISSTKSHLRDHKRSKHENVRNHVCDYIDPNNNEKCLYKSYYKSHLDNHKKAVHEREQNFQCNQCEYRSYYRHHVRKHMETVHRPRELPLLPPAQFDQQPLLPAPQLPLLPIPQIDQQPLLHQSFEQEQLFPIPTLVPMFPFPQPDTIQHDMSIGHQGSSVGNGSSPEVLRDGSYHQPLPINPFNPNFSGMYYSQFSLKEVDGIGDVNDNLNYSMTSDGRRRTKAVHDANLTAKSRSKGKLLNTTIRENMNDILNSSTISNESNSSDQDIYSAAKPSDTNLAVISRSIKNKLNSTICLGTTFNCKYCEYETRLQSNLKSHACDQLKNRKKCPKQNCDVYCQDEKEMNTHIDLFNHKNS